MTRSDLINVPGALNCEKARIYWWHIFCFVGIIRVRQLKMYLVGSVWWLRALTFRCKFAVVWGFLREFNQTASFSKFMKDILWKIVRFNDSFFVIRDHCTFVMWLLLLQMRTSAVACSHPRMPSLKFTTSRQAANSVVRYLSLSPLENSLKLHFSLSSA